MVEFLITIAIVAFIIFYFWYEAVGYNIMMRKLIGMEWKNDAWHPADPKKGMWPTIKQKSKEDL